ncbi:MAG TPA: hypothetical protein VID75_10580 [Acidimicrobiales bacterium]
MLDIGEGRGALVVFTTQDRLSEEIEIRPHDGEWTGLHTAVRARHMGEITRYAGVFGSLSAGLYDLRIRHDHDSQSDDSHSHASHSRGSRSEASRSHASDSAIDSGVWTVSVKEGAVAETAL